MLASLTANMCELEIPIVAVWIAAWPIYFTPGRYGQAGMHL